MEEIRTIAAEELLARIGARQAVCGVVGLGFIGSTFMDALVNAGFCVRAFDRSSSAVDRFQRWMRERNPASAAGWSADTNPAVLDGSEILVIAVRVLPREEGAVDLEPLESVAETLRA